MSPARTAAGVILDRDGTLVDVVRDEELGIVTTAFHPSQLRLLPGVVDGLRMLADAGFALAIATNQPGAAKGQTSREAIERTNDALVALLADHGVVIARVACCLHHPDGGPGGDEALVGPCPCRKPAPGMLEALVEALGLDRSRSWMVGDTEVDARAGRAARLRNALVFDDRRCDLCAFRPPAGPSPAPRVSVGVDLHAARFDDVARAIVAAR